MRKFVLALSIAAMMAGSVVLLSAQGPPPWSRGWVHIPESTIERLEDRGVFAHTNHLIQVRPMASVGLSGQTPSSMWAFYVNINNSRPGPTGNGSRVIALVGAYHYATALQDFNTFSAQFGLPEEASTDVMGSSNTVFQLVYAGNKKPRSNCGWAQEAALDIEWAHAMAPNAKIVLVEANSNSYSDLFAAVDKATKIVKGSGGEVSMSWGGSEFSTEGRYDSHFPLGNGVVYVASSGDTGGAVIYPSASPNVVAAGGTTLGSAGTETGWSGSGGGVSAYELKPDFQNVLSGSRRQVPDISYDANPSTGVAVYDSTPCQGYVGWMVFGGTSVSSPSLAGLINSAGRFLSDSQAQLHYAYPDVLTSYFYDVTSGTAGAYKAGIGYDNVTGIGSPRTLFGLQ